MFQKENPFLESNSFYKNIFQNNASSIINKNNVEKALTVWNKDGLSVMLRKVRQKLKKY